MIIKCFRFLKKYSAAIIRYNKFFRDQMIK